MQKSILSVFHVLMQINQKFCVVYCFDEWMGRGRVYGLEDEEFYKRFFKFRRFRNKYYAIDVSSSQFVFIKQLKLRDYVHEKLWGFKMNSAKLLIEFEWTFYDDADQ